MRWIPCCEFSIRIDGQLSSTVYVNPRETRCAKPASRPSSRRRGPARLRSDCHAGDRPPSRTLPGAAPNGSIPAPKGTYGTRVRAGAGRGTMSGASGIETGMKPRTHAMLSAALGRRLSHDIAIDLGTANTLVYVRGQGIIANEPSIVALHQADGSVIAVGREAKAMLGRTPDFVRVIRPLRDGVIANFDVTEQMLRYFFTRTQGRWTIIRPRVVIGVPWGITQVEKRAVRDSALEAGAREVYLIEGPMAAAIGAGVPVQQPRGSMIVDIGGGTTEAAVICLASIVYCKSVRRAGDEMDEAIIEYVKEHYNLMIGERRAEEVKITAGSAYPQEADCRTIEIKGGDIVDQLPKTILISAKEIREALQETLQTILNAVRAGLEHAPLEIAADIVETGIVLTGGGALLPGIDRLLREETQLPVTVADNALECAALGAGSVLDELNLLERVAVAA